MLLNYSKSNYSNVTEKGIYISFTSNSTIQIKKTINKNPQHRSRRRHCSLVSRNHFCHQTKVSLKERLLINSLEKIQKNLSSFSNERRVNFIDFLKEVSRSRDLCCWSNSLFQSLGPRDEILFDCILIDFPQNCSY